jgi:hypothetical protein
VTGASLGKLLERGRGQHDAAHEILEARERPRVDHELRQRLRLVVRDAVVLAAHLEVGEQDLEHLARRRVGVDRPAREHAHLGAERVVAVVQRLEHAEAAVLDRRDDRELGRRAVGDHHRRSAVEPTALVDVEQAVDAAADRSCAAAPAAATRGRRAQPP